MYTANTRTYYYAHTNENAATYTDGRAYTITTGNGVAKSCADARD